jgi:hypothetical protein
VRWLGIYIIEQPQTSFFRLIGRLPQIQQYDVGP